VFRSIRWRIAVPYVIAFPMYWQLGTQPDGQGIGQSLPG